MTTRKPIADLVEELRSWLPNYDHTPESYPTLLWRILASIPGGDQAEDMGYEPFQLGWQEVDQLGRVLEAIQDKQDVEDLIEGLLAEEEEEEKPPPPPPKKGRKAREPVVSRAAPGNWGPGIWTPSEAKKGRPRPSLRGARRVSEYDKRRPGRK
jgi:hypothetical protein